MRLISLTSIPPRFDKLEPGLASLLAQTAQVDEIRLVIPRRYRRFPDWDGTLPRVPKGIRITRTDADLGPATKILPTALDLAGNPDARILFCDDDRYYRPGWAARLFAESDARPDTAISGFVKSIQSYGLNLAPGTIPQPRARFLRRRWSLRYRLNLALHRLSLGLVPHDRRWRPIARAGHGELFFGFAGLVVRPPFFAPEDADIPDLAFPVDDIWLSGCLARKGIPIFAPAGLLTPRLTDADGTDPLYAARFDGAGRAALDLGCIRHLQQTYGIWAEA